MNLSPEERVHQHILSVLIYKLEGKGCIISYAPIVNVGQSVRIVTKDRSCVKEITRMKNEADKVKSRKFHVRAFTLGGKQWY